MLYCILKVKFSAITLLIKKCFPLMDLNHKANVTNMYTTGMVTGLLQFLKTILLCPFQNRAEIMATVILYKVPVTVSL